MAKSGAPEAQLLELVKALVERSQEAVASTYRGELAYVATAGACGERAGAVAFSLRRSAASNPALSRRPTHHAQPRAC